ncbi:MAG: hypothetical protein EBX80_07065 [Acidimicrobiia bacterium]|nr:hypothetical protein [Acidimicrobiia bacterium]
MNIVVVLGHPSVDSYCAAIFERIIRALEARPAHSVTAIRLHRCQHVWVAMAICEID